MPRSNDGRESRLTPSVADRVLARAAQLDAASDDVLSVAQLREIATEVGISSPALASALREYRAEEAPIPLWVRACLLGVPDRAMALRYYKLLIAGLCLSPVFVLTRSGPLRGGLGAIGLACFFLAAIWSTSRAVRWMDRHGWHRLP